MIFIIEISRNLGLGHLKRALNFYIQVFQKIDPKKTRFITFGDLPNFDDDQSLIQKLSTIKLENYQDLSTALNTVECNIPQKTKKGILVFDVYLSHHKTYLQDKIADLNFAFFTIGIYNEINHVSSVPFNLHINSNFFQSQLESDKIANTNYLLGPDFRLFPLEIIKCFNSNQTHKKTENEFHILMIAGNSDPKNRVKDILSFILKGSKFSTTKKITIHAVSPKIREITTSPISTQNNVEIYTYSNLNEEDLSKIYLKTNVAITAAGSTFWELNLFKIPCLLIPGSHTENEIADWLTENNFAELLINHADNIEISHFDKLYSWINNNILKFETTEINHSNSKKKLLFEHKFKAAERMQTFINDLIYKSNES